MGLEDSLKLLYKGKAEKLYLEGSFKEAIAEYKKIPNYEGDQEALEGIFNCNKAIGKNQVTETVKRVKSERTSPKPEVKPKTTALYFTETFADIIGLKRTKELIRINILTPLQSPDAYKIYNMQKKSGILLYGPPGTGKTSLIRAISGEAKIKVILARIDEIMSPYTAETERNMHLKFEEARKNAPCILFFDEMDALGAKRESLGGEGSAQILKQAVNVFLTEMDGIGSRNENIFIIGATNAPWSIDAGLKRGGRFDSAIYVPLPNYMERKELFRYYLKNRPRRGINYGRLARITDRFSPADIKRIADSACKIAIGEYIVEGQSVIKPVRMFHLLRVLRAHDTGKSSVDEWFTNTRKALLGKVRVQMVGNQKQVIKESASLEKDERDLYKELINDIKKQSKNTQIKKAIRWASLYVG